LTISSGIRSSSPWWRWPDYIKVDFAMTGAEERKRLLKRLDGVAVALLAEKVETQEEYKRACDEGFTLFQGYYFCRPLLMENRKVPATGFRTSRFCNCCGATTSIGRR